MKGTIMSVVGVAGSFIAGLFGGWSSALTTLVIFMGVDLVTGWILAVVFHKSPKTESGAYESKTGWKGLCRKCMTFLLVFVSYRIDIIIGSSYVMDAVCIAFIFNEIVSIIENAGLMGLPIPNVLKNAIDILKNKSEGAEKDA